MGLQQTDTTLQDFTLDITSFPAHSIRVFTPVFEWFECRLQTIREFPRAEARGHCPPVGGVVVVLLRSTVWTIRWTLEVPVSYPLTS